MIRLGGPVHADSPEAWIKALKERGYRAAYSPIDYKADSATIQAYAAAAQDTDIVIAEVGVWNNPLADDETERNVAIEKCEKQLALADELGALCCVNIAGSRGKQWDGPHWDNLTRETFDMIVEITRGIIDAVKPKRAFYSLEPMPWAYPDSVDSYLELIEAIDREQFAAHLDPVNWITSPQLYYNSGDLIRDSFKRLGPFIKSCHAKDTLISGKLTVHLDEAAPGQGELDYAAFLSCANDMPGDFPFMLEHLPMEAYAAAADFVRETADSLNITL